MEHIGVIFSEPMVLAILDGRKNQTRRLRGLEQINVSPDSWRYYGPDSSAHLFLNTNDKASVVIKSPFGAAGDELWVRETWGVHKSFESWWNDGNRDLGPMLIIHKAGYPSPPVVRWRSPIHLFERYSRIRRLIISVRPERLQDITEEDAKNEGVAPEFKVNAADFIHGRHIDFDKASSYRLGYKHLWDHLNGKKSPWSQNDWVWRIEFERIK